MPNHFPSPPGDFVLSAIAYEVTLGSVSPTTPYNVYVGGGLDIGSYTFSFGTGVDGNNVPQFDYTGFDQDETEAAMYSLVQGLAEVTAALMQVPVETTLAANELSRTWYFVSTSLSAANTLGGQVGYSYTENMPVPPPSS